MAHDARVKQMLDQHIKQAQQQVKNLEQTFREVGEQPRPVKCQGAEGVIQEFRSGAKEIEDAQLLDLYILGAWDKAEHYEIATYRDLVDVANLLGNTRADQLLGKNLSDQENSAKTIEKVEHDLGKQVIGGTAAKTSTQPKVKH